MEAIPPLRSAENCHDPVDIAVGDGDERAPDLSRYPSRGVFSYPLVLSESLGIPCRSVPTCIRETAPGDDMRIGGHVEDRVQR